MMRIASIDIGKKNFAQYIEDFDETELEKYKTTYSELPKTFQRRVKGKMNANVEEILQGIFLCGKRVQFGVYDLRRNKSSNDLDIPTRRNILAHLDRFKDLWSTCDVVIIEQQYFHSLSSNGARTPGGGANVDAIKMAELVLAWFLITFPEKPHGWIGYFGSQFKTQMLGADPKLTKIQRKTWAVDKSKEIYTSRNDEDALMLYDLSVEVKGKRFTKEERVSEFLCPFEDKEECVRELAEKIVREKQKLDDVADCCLQAQAYKFRNIVACF